VANSETVEKEVGAAHPVRAKRVEKRAKRLLKTQEAAGGSVGSS